MPYKELILKCTKRWLTIHYHNNEDISKEENRRVVASSNVCGLFSSGERCRILLAPAGPPADSASLPTPAGLPLVTPLGLPVPFLFPGAVALVFPCDGSRPPAIGGDSRYHQQLTLVHPNRELSAFLQCTVFTCQQKHLQTSWDTERTLFMWLR